MRIWIAIFLLLSSLWAECSKADEISISRINNLFKPFAANTLISAHVVRVHDGATLFSLKPDELRCPASVTKLVTAAATLARFTPAHVFKTKLYYSGNRYEAKISGDLIIKGDGDPFVVSEKLWQLAADLRNMGLKEFGGDIIIDNSLFAGPARDISRKNGEKRSNHAYDAPVSAFAVNFNTLAIAMAPSEKIGGRAFAGLDPYPLKSVALINRLQTIRAGAAEKIEVSRSSALNSEMRLSAIGAIPLDGQIRKIYRSVGDHILAAGEYVRAFLASEGIIIKGKVREGALPANAKPLYELESYSLGFIVSGLNKFSNNFIADVLVKRLGAMNGQGSMDNGMRVLTEFLRSDLGIKDNFVLKNGSGLDTENRLSARQMTKLLTYMEQRMDLFPEFLASLPAAGWDGTLDKRFDKPELVKLKGQVRAKTGTLTEPVTVASLAGYFRHPKHGLVAFAILENGIEGKPQPTVLDLRSQQDAVMGAFFEAL